MPNLIIGDCETSGLDEAKDHILEIALVAVEIPTFREVACISSVVVPPLWPTVYRNMHAKVQEMHGASGLTNEVLAAHLQDDGNHTPEMVEAVLLKFMRQHAPQTAAWHTPLGGCNPDFDRRFLRKRMPRLHAAFHYRNFDVRSITQLQDWVFGHKHVESPHRALADARKAAADVRAFIGIDAVIADKPRQTRGQA